MVRSILRSKDPKAPPYLFHFGLLEAPFDGGDGRFFYADPPREKLLTTLHQLTQHGADPILVSGWPGTGKTLLLDQYLARGERHWRICRISAADALDAAQLFTRIARCYGIAIDGAPSSRLLDRLKTRLAALQPGHTAVLVIDDADLLDDRALEMVLYLSSLHGEHGALMKIVLFADPAVLQRLDNERFRQVPSPRHLELTPFDQVHTGLYLVHRLTTAGFSAHNPFNARLTREIHGASKGVPASINELAHDALVEKLLTRPVSPWRHIFGPLTLGVTAAVAIAGGAFLLHGRSETDRIGESAVTVASNPSPPGQRPGQPAAQSDSEPGAVLGTDSAPAPASSSGAGVPLVSDEMSDGSPPPEKVADGQDRASTSAPTIPEEEASQGRAVNGPKTIAVEAHLERAVAPEPDTSKDLLGSQWVATQPDQHFTLQFLAAKEQATVQRFLRKSSLPQPAASFETNDTPALHLIIQGSYPTRDAAEKAIAALAPDLRSLSPWPRSFEALKALLPSGGNNAKSSSPMLKDAVWIWARNPGHFTIRLAEGRDLGAEQRRFAGLASPGPLARYQVQRGGKPWLGLIYGEFETRPAAEATLRKLPGNEPHSEVMSYAELQRILAVPY